MMEIPIVIGTTPKSLVKGLEDLEILGQGTIIQKTTVRRAKILRKISET